MENLNAEQVKKALSVCWDTTCSDCEFDSNCGGHWQVLENAFALINSYEQKIKELTEENNRLSFFNEQKAEAVRYEAITKYKKSIIDYYNNDSRYDRPNAHTLLVRLFELLDEKAKEILEGEK